MEGPFGSTLFHLEPALCDASPSASAATRFQRYAERFSMFDFFRKHTRLLQFLLVLVIFPSFVLVGVQGYSRFTHTSRSYLRRRARERSDMPHNIAGHFFNRRFADIRDLRSGGWPHYRRSLRHRLPLRGVNQTAVIEQNEAEVAGFRGFCAHAISRKTIGASHPGRGCKPDHHSVGNRENILPSGFIREIRG